MPLTRPVSLGLPYSPIARSFLPSLDVEAFQSLDVSYGEGGVSVFDRETRLTHLKLFRHLTDCLHACII